MISLARRRRTLSRVTAVTLGMALVAAILVSITVAPARAGDAPPAPVGPFNAPLCEGTTDDDPTQVDPAYHAGYTDLTAVFGARLDSYNKGNVVPLYDTTGNASGTYPPLCGTYYDPETNSAKSVWMFCTDIDAHVCGDIGPGGTLHDAGQDVGELIDQANNPRLTADQERIIAWLITRGYDYVPNGGMNDTGATAADKTTTANRMALQNLIWCVSDPDFAFGPFQAVCAENLPPSEQAEILTKVPGTAVVNLSLTSQDAAATVGRRHVITLQTNVFNQPIRLTATGTAAGTLQVCEGPGTLNGDDLTVSGTDPNQQITVKLCLQPTSTGSYGLEASVQAVQSDRLQWGKASTDCQVFARFRHDAGVAVRDSVNFSVANRSSKPKIVTQASSQVATPGASLYDTVRISNFVPGHGAVGKATLYGPVSKVTSKVCTPANKVATVRFKPRNGVVRTPRIKVSEPGYYTWIAETTSDARNKAASHRCGLAAETTLVRKKPYRVTAVDSGFSGPVSPIASRAATDQLTMPKAGIRATINAVGHRDHRMLLPDDASLVGLLKASARPGDKVGTVVLAGHVSDRSDNPGALWNLKKVRKGQVLTYWSGGKVYRYKVTGVQRYSRDNDLPAHLFRTGGAPRLVVISCSDKVIENGRWHYVNNLVVTAKPIR